MYDYMDACVVLYGSVNRWGLRGDQEEVLWRLQIYRKKDINLRQV
jgi:hypothetical protein